MPRAVGRNVLRKEGHEKVTGLARYIDDIRFEDVLYVRTIRSTVPAGEIADIRYDFDRTGYTIVDHADIPGRNIVAPLEERAQLGQVSVADCSHQVLVGHGRHL
jgi:CO/xanthine dehydrogenase Mo-binding subunit